MNEARKIVFCAARQEDVEQKFLEGQEHLTEYCKNLPIIIVLIILFAVLSILLGLWQGARVSALISAL